MFRSNSWRRVAPKTHWCKDEEWIKEGKYEYWYRSLYMVSPQSSEDTYLGILSTNYSPLNNPTMIPRDLPFNINLFVWHIINGNLNQIIFE